MTCDTIAITIPNARQLATRYATSRSYGAAPLLRTRLRGNEPGLLRTTAACGKLFGQMAREIVWLENISFAAWGCSACNWILPGPRPTESGRSPATIKEAFDKHECAKSPRQSRTKAGGGISKINPR
jgi:hypothetical protein